MKVLYRILLAVFIIIFVVSGSMLGYNLYQSYKEKSGLEELAAEVEDTETSGTGINGNPDVSPEMDEAARLQKYQLLHEKNKDMVGWIKIPNTAVNYPVMQTMEENEFYLRRNFQKEYAMSGLPFLDVQSNLGKPSSNFVIYGHNMDNKTMFYDILKYEEEDYWKKHPIVRFDTLKELGE
ncbi:MAG: class B sortase, partial [Oscillospiraceae bacterium]